jgi:predicted CxxxxCH...CXXCH cytochrome family protein
MHGTTNLEMVKTTINGYGVAFTARTGAGSFDPLEVSGANTNTVCVVCHQNSTENGTLNVAHNFRTSTVNPDHNEGSNCATCHPHGNSSDSRKFGFPQAACNSCHGSATTGMPSPADGATYHADANNVIGTRGGDNTSHKIHVNYLANKRGVPAASACYICHKGGGAQESGHPANPTNRTFKSGGQPTAVPYLQVAMDNGGTGSILNVWNNVGTGPTYSGTRGAAADNTNGWKTCSNTKCHYALSPSWSGRRQVGAGDTVTISGDNTAPGTIGQSASDDFIRFRLQITAMGDNNQATLMTVAVTATGTNPVTDIDNVLIYKDANADGIWQVTDNVIGFTAAPGSSRVTVTLSTPQTITATISSYYFVVLKLKSTATVNGTVGAQIAAAGDITLAGSDSMATANLPISSSTSTVTGSSAPPAIVTDFNASDGESGQSTLTWTNPADVDLDIVRVMRKTGSWPTGPSDAGATAAYDVAGSTPSAAVNFVDNGLTNGTSYYYAVYSRDSTGNWNASLDNTAPGVNANMGVPGPILLVPVADTDIRSNAASTNYGTATTMRVQGDYTAGIQRAMLQFDLSTIPSATTITSATLSLYKESGAFSRTLNAHEIIASWVETFATWNNSNANFNPTVAASANGGAANPATVVWDLTSMVQGWINTPANNFGVVIRDSSESGTSARYEVFTSREGTTPANRPKLTITYSGAVYAPPRTTGDTTAIACNTCHQFGPDDATAGYKDDNQYYYDLPGSHAAHGVSVIAGNNPTADNALNTCTLCHPASTNTYDSDHMDGVVDIRSGSIGTRIGGGGYTGYGMYDNATRTCSNVYCHAGTTPPWGTTLAGGCFACHQGTEGTNKPQGASNYLPNAVDNTQYFQSGHGRTGSNYPVSGNPPAGKWNAGTGGGCYTTDPEAGCHASTASHVPASASDPYRLGAAYADNTTALCLACHGAAGPAATRDMQEHSKAVTGSSKTWPGSDYPWKCVDCHDPHGDGTNSANRLQMIRSAINNPTGTDNANVGSDGKGSPKRAPGWTNIAFTSIAGFAPGSYAQPGTSTWGICEGCHRNTTAYGQTQDNAASHAGRTSRCTTCHPHSLGFAATCFSCHGSSGNLQYWPAGSPGTYPNRAGAHGNHMDAIGTWLFEETSATGLLANTGKGSTSAKQIAICGWCHPNPGNARPGTTELDHMDNTVTPGIADVHRDGRSSTASYLQYYNGNLAARGGVNDNLATFDTAAHTCSNVLCHNRVTTPGTPYSWNTPPPWATDNTCASTKCHPSAAPASSGVHTIHVSPKVLISPYGGGMGYSCSECHVVPTSLRHGNGQVNMGFGGLETSVGGGNGFYDKDDGGGSVPSAGDNDFRAYDGSYHHSCANIYCHGGDNPEWSGSGTRPAWDNDSYMGSASERKQCGLCHAGFGSPYSYGGAPRARVPLVTGNHKVHFKQYTSVFGDEAVSRGPRMEPHPHTGCISCHNMVQSAGSCERCHPSSPLVDAVQPTGTHADGKVDFRTTAGSTGGSNPPPGVLLAATPACDYCHSTATVTTRTYPTPGTTGVAAAKANWDNGSFQLDCLTCHNGAAPGNSNAGGDGIAAPNVYGDGTGYGAEARGHNRPTSSGNYPGTGNPAGNRICGECHNTASMHIDGVDNTTFAGNRLLDNVNGVTGITTGSGLCSACHTNAGTSPATKKSVNTHGNTGFAKRLEGSTFALECAQCHEPHGMVNVSSGATGVNLWMINPTITVATGNTVSPVRLFAKSGANSFNAYDPGAGNQLNASMYTANANDQLCAVCHANSLAAGFPMTWNIGARHNAPGYVGNEAGKDCSICHSHNQDGLIGTVDGLMPLACNECHSYPGLDNTGVMKLMSAGHRKHVGQPFPGGGDTNNKGYDCTLCHFSYTHNQSGLVKGQVWPANYYDNVNIRFDNAWNPGSPTYAGVNAGTGTAPGIGGAGGACAVLYCHGGNASLNARWGGSATTPTWSGTVSCGGCHDTGTSDTTSGTRISTGNHPVHIDITNYIYGPGMASFSTGGGCTEGTGCHTRYDLAPIAQGGLHANNLKELRSTSTDNGYVGAALSTTQVCRNCHSTYTSASILVSGDNQVRTQANWNDNTFYVDCITCHNGTAAGTQATAGIGGGGGRAAAIEGTYFASGHGLYGFPAPLECGWCHGYIGHIGAARPVATNPYRIETTFNQRDIAILGELDSYCSAEVCHGSDPPNDHTWIVNGGDWDLIYKEDTDTHPTSAVAVPAGKERWYQVPQSTHVPLFGDLLDNGYNRSGGTNNYVLCISCHDPHGVGTAPIDPGVRRFSGQNTDPKGNKFLRFNYSTGTPTELCAQCHK